MSKIQWGVRSLEPPRVFSRVQQRGHDTSDIFQHPQLPQMPPKLRKFGDVISANRQANAELNSDTRAAILAQLDAGKSQRAVAEQFGVSRGAVTRTLSRYNENATIKSLPRDGHPRALDRRDKRLVCRIARRDFRSTNKELFSDTGAAVSPSTIKRTLRSENIRKWKAKKRIFLSKEAAKQRLQFTYDWKGRDEELVEVFPF
jgi:transposase